MGLLKKPSRGFQNEKVLALVVAAAMGLSSVAFAADAASTTEVQQPAILPFTIRNITKRPKPAAEQKAQAAKKHKAAANRLLSKSPGCKETS
ncbi:acid resistance repetitive basic protein Asr [Klebsiella pneumoniae]|uniref:Acid shock protein n=1 Tax=Klebsiella pneumoniae TaxID=573 RepID=A0A939NP02_KLEPN|nr:acid resistance repetitive basic protein Asr [Klebsiella pneumoniae]